MGRSHISFKMLSVSTCFLSLELHERFLAFISIVQFSLIISDASPSQPHTSPIRSKIKALMNLALARMIPSWCQDKKKRKGLVIKATNTTLSRIKVIHEFYYVFLSVSACFLTDLKSWEYVALKDYRSTEQWNTCAAESGRMSLAYFQEKKLTDW